MGCEWCVGFRKVRNWEVRVIFVWFVEERKGLGVDVGESGVGGGVKGIRKCGGSVNRGKGYSFGGF